MARKRTEKAADYSEETKMGGRCTRAKKYMKSTNEKKPHEIGQRLMQLKNPAQEVPTVELPSGKKLQPSGKLKLQLFPFDDHTREGLEKDGFHPYLELTLSSRKKISSVLKHLHSKWGSSQIAQGEPRLYPYDKLVSFAGYKWTTNSSSFTAGDVYAAIGAPTAFRLRYGWTSETEDKTSESPSLPISRTTDFLCEGKQKESSDQAEGANEQIGEGDNLSRPSTEDKATNPTVSERILPDGQVQSKDKDGTNDYYGPTSFPWDDLTNLSIGGLLSEASLRATNCSTTGKTSNGETTTLWVDNLTNISIGGLLSEASLHGRLTSNREQEPNRSNDGLLDNNRLKVSVGGLGRSSDCDKAWSRSDAGKFSVSRTDKTRGGTCEAAPCELRSSILDAEDTCHAFSFGNNLPSQWKGATTTSTTTGPEGARPVSILDKGRGQDEGVMKQKARSESGKQLLSSSLLFDQERSLGLSGIKWGDSLGPFDMGLSSSLKITAGGDSIGFAAIVNSMQKKA
ncbi:PREDICTED: TSL-kinase interacting protein 1 isoform X2 [Tarenaya hassleriana]|uniref:TSL-kinase interacting protein 1 isoform X2 n=1 Tax=Tarenaya hassleriana TaxID=28532 RepID=UPI00053C65A4|nr:PREDICTED: TSL-kinase interacting protein 1 isoform X2 [Tarenaya hassleriana]